MALTGLQPLGGSFPDNATAGYTGEVSQWAQGTTHVARNLPQDRRNYNLKKEFAQDSYPEPYDSFGDFGEYVLPGEQNPDRTPRTHAAPYPGWAGSYHGDDIAEVRNNSTEIHSEDFGALRRRKTSPRSINEPQVEIDEWEVIGENNLQPLTGQIRARGGYDTTQGYDLRNRYGFDAGHRKRERFTEPQPTYSLSPGERPYVVPQGGVNAVFTDSVQGPQVTPYSYGHQDATVISRDPSGYAPPPEPDNFSGQYVTGPVSGWD